MDHHRIIKLWTVYGFNYEYDFIEKAFAKKGSVLVNHLKEKFNSLYKRYGSEASFFVFWANLDEGNRQILEDYVMDNFKG